MRHPIWKVLVAGLLGGFDVAFHIGFESVNEHLEFVLGQVD